MLFSVQSDKLGYIFFKTRNGPEMTVSRPLSHGTNHKLKNIYPFFLTQILHTWYLISNTVKCVLFGGF